MPSVHPPGRDELQVTDVLKLANRRLSWLAAARAGSSGSPQQVKIFWITSGWIGSMKLTILIVGLQEGH